MTQTLSTDLSAPDAPAEAPERADRPAPTTPDAGARLEWRARRKKAAALRDASFEWLADGFTHQEIAAARKVSVAVVRRDIARAIRARQLETREGHAQLQSARLTKALTLAAHKVKCGDLAAIGPLVKVVTALDRYQGGAPARVRRAPALAAPPEAPALPAPPLALAFAGPPLAHTAAIEAGVDDGEGR